MSKIIVYTDGSALNNGREISACGWACKLIYNGYEKMKSGGDIGKTNNYMEMVAVLQAMKSIKRKNIPVEVYSDSQYVVQTLRGHYTIRKNKELWEKIMEERRKFSNIRFFWVKGHDINKHNNDVDFLAVSEAKKASLMGRDVN